MIDKLKKVYSGVILSKNSIPVKDKIIVFESDDWGGIRTPNIEAANKLKKIGAYSNDSAYLDVDTLESESDLVSLFAVLKKYKDHIGNFPLLTANFVMGNPDFPKIKDSNFNEYFYEPFTETYNTYFGKNQMLDKIKLGVNSNIFYPQFHGREHVNVPLWLNQLKAQNKFFLAAFDEKFFGIQTKELESRNRNVQISFELPPNSKIIAANIQEGLLLFENIFGYKSKSFIPNNYVWSQNSNELLKINNIQFLQGLRSMAEPLIDENEVHRKLYPRYGGRKGHSGIINIVRNASFEPSLTSGNINKALEKCLTDIYIAFLFKQPAVISCHRLNFVSGLNLENRESNLQLFEELIHLILKKWPDVKFMNTVQLGQHYKEIIA